MNEENVTQEQSDFVHDCINNLMKDFQKEDIDPDFAAYMIISAGVTLAHTVNKYDPVMVTQLIAAALMMANGRISASNQSEEEDDDDEEFEGIEMGVRH